MIEVLKRIIKAKPIVESGALNAIFDISFAEAANLTAFVRMPAYVLCLGS
jgi:hypothetical protein